MKIFISQELIDENMSLRKAQREKLQSGKVSVRWSQMRGGFAIFVSGRMEFNLFNSESLAWDWINEILAGNEEYLKECNELFTVEK